MDPLSVLSLVETCAGLTVTAGKLAVGLKTLAENYRHAAMTFRSLSSQCKLFACAVRSIQQWLEDSPDGNKLDNSILEQLIDSLECANDTIYALESELVKTSNGSVNNFWEKLNVIWNQQVLKNLEDCVHKQISSLSVILQIMNLPTKQSQKDELAERSSVFVESRSSARSIRDPASSTIRGVEVASMTEVSTITSRLSRLPGFDFDEILMTSQVYLRNRNRTLALHSGSQQTHTNSTTAIPTSAPLVPTNDSEIDRIQLSQSKNVNREILVRRYNSIVDSYNLLRGAFTSLKKEFNGTKDDRNNLWDAHQQLQYENRDLKHQLRQRERHDPAEMLTDNQHKGQQSSVARPRKSRPSSTKPPSIKIPSIQPPIAEPSTLPKPHGPRAGPDVVGIKFSHLAPNLTQEHDLSRESFRSGGTDGALPTPPTSASLKNMDLVNFLQDSASPDMLSYTEKAIKTGTKELSSSNRGSWLSTIDYPDFIEPEDPKALGNLPQSDKGPLSGKDSEMREFLKISDMSSDFQWPWDS